MDLWCIQDQYITRVLGKYEFPCSRNSSFTSTANLPLLSGPLLILFLQMPSF